MKIKLLAAEHENIMIIDKNNQPVAIIMFGEVVVLEGYYVNYDVGEH